MDLLDKLKRALNIVAKDGTHEIIKDWINRVENQAQVDSLLNQPAFKHVISDLKTTFKERLRELIAQDPELKGIQKVFNRTIGSKNTDKLIEKQIEELIGTSDLEA